MSLRSEKDSCWVVVPVRKEPAACCVMYEVPGTLSSLKRHSGKKTTPRQCNESNRQDEG